MLKYLLDREFFSLSSIFSQLDSAMRSIVIYQNQSLLRLIYQSPSQYVVAGLGEVQWMEI